MKGDNLRKIKGVEIMSAIGWTITRIMAKQTFEDFYFFG